MIELSPAVVTLLMLAAVFIGLLSGFPVAFVLGAAAIAFGYPIFGNLVAELIYDRVWGFYTNYIILAVPLFVFMGLMLERSGVTERLYDALYLWLGGFRGGLAVVTVLVGTILAACIGVITASVTLLTLIALPSMVRRGYSKSLATGAVAAGGCLGILIPPSVMLVVYGPMAAISVGKLFFGAFGPGLLLSASYITYIIIRSLLQPNVAPPVPAAERAVPFREKTIRLLTVLVPPMVLIFSVLGVIFFGIAAVTEAAGIGALAAVALAIAYRKFTWQVLKDVTLLTMQLSGWVMLMAGMAFAFTGVFIGAGGGLIVKDLILATPGGSWGAFAVIMLITFILGFFIDWWGIVFIMVPIITPIVPALGFDPVWFAIMVCVNLQMAFMTPPMAAAIFLVKGAAEPSLGITTPDIIRGVVPFVGMIVITLGLCVAFPQIITWLPNMMIK
ncbi:MAG: TRAP transporter large permease subunit [Dehalococcoidia bacterium]|nr:TRAP transporter large permease subunit [Dehalococcoidia bacterium]